MMMINGLLKKILHSALGLTVYKKSPLGIDIYDNLKHFYSKSAHFQVFFDVGANIGQSAIQMHKAFPSVNIYSFEPQPHVYDVLQEQTKNTPQIYSYNMALGESSHSKSISIDTDFEFSSRFSMKNTNAWKDAEANKIDIQVKTIDQFAEELNISHIDYLKIDTEGFELEVLEGAKTLIANGGISFIEAEVSMNSYNSFHVSYERVRAKLDTSGYELFGIYEQVHEWKAKRPVLRRANALFIHHSCSGS